MIPPTTRNGLAIATVTDRDKVLLLLRLGLLNLNKGKVYCDKTTLIL